MMKRAFPAALLALCLLAAPRVYAQEDIAKSWGEQRAEHQNSMDATFNGSMLQRREAFIATEKDPPSQWWSHWKSLLPYDKNVTITPPAGQDIPASPDRMSNSAYGQNAAQLVYGKQGTTDASGLPSGPTDANESTGPVQPMSPKQMFGK
jgi:hypothetical protein